MERGTIANRVILLTLLLSASIVGAQERASTARSFDRFEFDTATARGVWAEVATALAHGETRGFSFDVITVEPRLVYGGEMGELGLFIPYEHVEAETPSFFGAFTREENGIGDIRLYGKLIPLRTDLVDAGLGLELSVPTGNDDKGLGTGELGILPYGAVGLHVGPADVRAHFGYEAFTSSNDALGVERAPNVFVYGGGVFAGLTERIGARAEVVGATLDGQSSHSPISFEPGLDLRLPLDGFDLFIRPTGAVGLTSDAPDWGVGGGIALAWNPS